MLSVQVEIGSDLLLKYATTYKVPPFTDSDEAPIRSLISAIAQGLSKRLCEFRWETIDELETPELCKQPRPQ